MKTNPWYGIAFAASMLIIACDTTVKTDNAEVSEAKETTEVSAAASRLQIDTTQSEVRWVGSKVTGRHPGTIGIQEGSLAVENDRIVGGNFVMDMSRLIVRDEALDEESTIKLTGHLKSADFFEVEQHPTATFEITAVEPLQGADSASQETDTDYTAFRDYSEFRVMDPTHRVTGNLTMKGETKSITFPAKINMANGEVQAKANFNIDRNDWNLKYGADKSLGDKMIYSDVNLGFDIVARQ